METAIVFLPLLGAIIAGFFGRLIGDKASMGNTQPIRHQRTYAHEVGHNFGLFHNSSQSATIGIDVEHHLWITEALPKIKPTTQKDIMFAGLLTFEAWVRPSNYTFFYDAPAFAAGTDGFNEVQAPTSGPAHMICGLWDRQAGSLSFTGSVTLAEHERRYVTRVLEACAWKIKGAGGAAEVLGLPPSTLTSRMKKLGIARP